VHQSHQKCISVRMCVHFRGHSKILGCLAHTALAEPLFIQGLSEDIGKLVFDLHVVDDDVSL
jgi:hypothetical protein